MIIWGITALGHDASITVISNGNILFAAHSERYSRIKNDENLNKEIINEALNFGQPDKIIWYEKPVVKKVRQAVAGQWTEVWDKNKLPKNYLKNFFDKVPPIEYALHHESHAAAGAFTSPFREAAIVVLDAIGEFNTCSVWKYEHPNKLKKIRVANYPHSFGLLYSAFTQRCNLKPNEEEYIMMGMSAYGKPRYVHNIKIDFIDSIYPFRLKSNPHIGIGDYLPNASHEDIACSIQAIADEVIVEYCSKALVDVGSRNLVFMGGVALNCVSNEKLLDICDSIWIMPNPGDAGNSLGAAALGHGGVVHWDGPFLGTLIGGAYPIDDIIEELEKNKICGVANGRAEFGPRALGNRSLCADPRGPDVKDKMNVIKKRQKFRPFAPMILEEHVHDYFEMPGGISHAPYMQFVAKCKKPEEFPAIIHEDGTSRVQTVRKEEHPDLHNLLTKFYKQTGCPMLLNTSLNIKGQPIVNDEKDAEAFAQHYGVKVHVRD